MIFVTVGTHPQGFDRLLEEVDELVGKKEISDKVVMQIGSSKYTPKNCSYTEFIDAKKIGEFYKKSNLVITHAGAGSIIEALIRKKRVIVVPRLKKYGEVVNDHQLQLARALEKQKKVLACYNTEKILETIRTSKRFNPKLDNKNTKIGSLIQEYIKTID